MRPLQVYNVILDNGDLFQIEATDFEPSGSSVSFYREYPSLEPFGNNRVTYIGYYSKVSSVTLSGLVE